MLCSGDMFKLYYCLVFVESFRLSWSTKVLTEAKTSALFIFSKIPPFYVNVAMVSSCHPQFPRANR